MIVVVVLVRDGGGGGGGGWIKRDRKYQITNNVSAIQTKLKDSSLSNSSYVRYEFKYRLNPIFHVLFWRFRILKGGGGHYPPPPPYFPYTSP